jgi:apolipoprotein N-acyltransferase
MLMDNLFVQNNYKNNIEINNIIISPSICYEILFPEQLRSNTNKSNILVNLSDLGWFKQYNAKYYLLRLAQIRAIESQKPMIYVVNQGISAFIDKNGKILKQTKSNSQEILSYDIIPHEGETIYSEHGNNIIYIYIIFMVLFYIFFKDKE